ncbi:nitrilase-related carbon-nitrogen hydrolase, partial [Streptomyces turgidiscabies]|uniref:nitrilase-related carbon-nitrogen hydrolase n=1 Tax=Streptomyces turgidiscabies TaxID=85558 RepID=UPI0038F69D72
MAIADPRSNAAALVRLAAQAGDQGAGLVLFPELSLSGYALDDLHHQDVVLDAVVDGIASLVAASRDLLPVIVAGAALRHQGRLYNTA